MFSTISNPVPIPTPSKAKNESTTAQFSNPYKQQWSHMFRAIRWYLGCVMGMIEGLEVNKSIIRIIPDTFIGRSNLKKNGFEIGLKILMRCVSDRFVEGENLQSCSRATLGGEGCYLFVRQDDELCRMQCLVTFLSSPLYYNRRLLIQSSYNSSASTPTSRLA
jgi:hypothetical protein